MTTPQAQQRPEAAELFIDRTADVMLHGYLDDAALVVVTLQHKPNWALGMMHFGLVIATAPPEQCFIDESRSPPAFVIGETMFPLTTEQAHEAKAWLASITPTTGEVRDDVRH